MQNSSSGTPLGTAKVKKTGSKKITRKLVALSAAAILAVYSVGYINTEPAAAQIAAQSSIVMPTPANAAIIASATTVPVASPATVPVASDTAVPVARSTSV